MVGENLVLGALAVIAGLLLVAGLIQAFQPRPRRRLRRGRIRARSRVRGRRSPAPPASPERTPTRISAGVPAPPQTEPLPSPPPLPAAVPDPMPDAVSPAEESESLLLEKCIAFYQAKQYQDLISAAESQLQRASDGVGSTEPAPVMGAVWGLVGLSKQALGDDEAAHAAFEAAIRASPEAGRHTYRGYLAALASRVAHQLLDRAQTFGQDEGDERVETFKQAVLWLRRGVGAAPDDENLRVSLDRAQQELWAAIEQLTAHAIRALQDGQEQDVLISLGRTTALLASISEDALVPKRREEAYRRLWWAYTKLGVGRLEAGEFEAALEPLLHALKLDLGDPERQQETREALVRTLEAIADRRTGLIDQLLKDGQRESALAEGERLLALIREGMEAGLSDEEISSALTKTHHVIEQVQQS